MLGSSMGRLSIYMKTQADGTNLLWRFGEDLGNAWNYAQTTVPFVPGYSTFQIVIEGERGNGSYSNMAIDDLQMEVGQCQSFGACTFENDAFCGWYNVIDGRDQLDWEFGEQKTDTIGTGPM